MEVIANMRKEKFIPLTEPEPAVAFGGKKVIFFLNPNVGMIEIIE